MESLNAISPVDGRYRKQVDALGGNFSEAALIRYRVRVEIEYFIALCELPLPQLATFDKSLYAPLREIYKNFTDDDALEVKEIEKTTKTEEKALTYILDTIGAEGILSISQAIQGSGISRPVFTSLLDKLDRYQAAEVKNMGVKGTYIHLYDHILVKFENL